VDGKREETARRREDVKSVVEGEVRRSWPAGGSVLVRKARNESMPKMRGRYKGSQESGKARSVKERLTVSVRSPRRGLRTRYVLRM
jgi:hypothetical protein